MKRVSKHMITFGLVGSLLSYPISSYAATDDITGNFFENDMRVLIEKGVMKGYGDHTYLPEKNVTRAEFATFLARALQLPAADSHFTDVPATYVLYDGVSKAAGANIIHGRGDHTFDPNANVTREEMAIMVKNALTYKKVQAPQAPLTFVDNDHITYKEHVQFVVGAGIIKGYEDHTFRPSLPATRGTAAAFINRMMQVIENGKVTDTNEAYILTSVNQNGEEREAGRYQSYAEAVKQAQNTGVTAVKHKGEFVWIKDGFAVAKKIEGNTISLYNSSKAYVNYFQYGTEFKVLQVEGDWVKVQTSDYNGYYVKKNEVTLYPAGTIKPSYYYVKSDGYLYHKYYSYYSTTPNYIDYRYGKAPSFMKPGQQMYSVDGKTFENETFYQYFNYLSLRSKTSYTAEELDQYVKSNKPDSPLIGLGAKFKEVESKYHVNALFLYALAVHESNYGTSELAREKNNLFGLRATDDNPFGNGLQFNSKEDCIEYVAKVYMNEGYLNPSHWRYDAAYTGNKAFGINSKYASDQYWGAKVAGHMSRFDSSLGEKDYNKYKLVRAVKNAEVKRLPSTDSSKLYQVRQGAVITVIGEEIRNGQAWIKVISDEPSVADAYIAKENVEYVNH